jgi:hypothetical protein
MSKIALSGDASGTGTFTIASPNTNSNYTLTLPANTGTLLSTASNLAGLTGAGKILQVVQSNQFSGVTTTSGSTQFSSSTPSITPSATSSKILQLWSTSVIVDCDNDSQGANNGFVRFEYQIGGTGGAWSSLGQFTVPGRGGNGTFTNAVFLSSLSTTSTVYFRMGIGKEEGARNILINDAWGSNRVFLLEVGA